MPTLDDFEDGDITEYGGDTGQFTVQQSTIYEGQDALGFDPDSNFADYVISDTGVSVAQGDTIECRLRATGDANSHFYFFTQNENGASGISGYRAELRVAGASFRIQRVDNGDVSSLASDSDTEPSADEWYRVNIQVDGNGNITVTFYNNQDTQESQLTATDTNYTSGGIGWGGIQLAPGSGYVAFHDLAVKNPSSASPPAAPSNLNATVQ